MKPATMIENSGKLKSLLRILLIEHHPNCLQMLRDLLTSGPIQTEITTVGRSIFSEALSCADEHDLIIADLELPETEDLEFADSLRQRATLTPIIVLIDRDTEAARNEAIRIGVQDFLVKELLNSEVVHRSVRYSIELHRCRKQHNDCETQIRRIIENTGDAIITVDRRGIIIFANSSAGLLFGREQDELINKEIGLTATNGKIDELEIIRGDGRIAVAEMQLIESMWDGEPAFMASFTDVTKRDKIGEHFVRSQHIGNFARAAGVMVHDLNNVLTPILHWIPKLKTMNSADPAAVKFCNTIYTSARRGQEIVEQIREFIRDPRDSEQLLSISEVIEDVKEMIANMLPASITIKSQVRSDSDQIRGNSIQLRQALCNLCLNARDAMSDGGIIAVDLDTKDTDTGFATPHGSIEPGSFVMVTITDTGSGISSTHIDNIFEPFFTTHADREEAGLGLSTAASIIRFHGGLITVKSEIGSGSEFKVYLPAIVPPSPEPYAGTTISIPKGTMESVLVVDEDVTVCEIMKVTLEQCGYRVVIANDKADAVALIAHAGGKFSAVIIDIETSAVAIESMISAINSLNSNLRIIGISGNLTRETISAAIPQQIDVFLEKPFSTETLLNVLDGVLSNNCDQLA